MPQTCFGPAPSARGPRALACLTALWLAPPALAQTPPAAAARPPAAAASGPAAVARQDPLDPRAQVPTLRYATALSSYRRHDAAEPRPWRDANEAVARIGGWRAYAREAHAPEAPAAPANKPASAASPVAPPASAPVQGQPHPHHHPGARHGHH